MLTLEEAKKKREKKREESRNRRHSIDEEILPIPSQLENTILDTLEEELKQMNLIVGNTIHSPLNHISVSSSLDGTLHFASNNCASTSRGKE